MGLITLPVSMSSTIWLMFLNFEGVTGLSNGNRTCLFSFINRARAVFEGNGVD